MSVVVEARELRPAVRGDADVRLVRVSPDGRRIAYTRAGGGAHGVFLAEPETGWSRRLAHYDAPIEDLAWSPDGAAVAYTIGAADPLAATAVAWAGTSAPGEAGRVPGLSFAWSPQRPVLYVADPRQKALRRCDVATGKQQKIADLEDDGDADLPPRIAVSPDRKQIAFSVRHAHDDVCEVWIAKRGDAGVTASLLTKIPGSDVHVMLFWSPKGNTLGLDIVHLEQDQSAILVVPGLRGDGEVLHEAERIDAPVTPAWSPSGRTIAFFGAHGAGPAWNLERPESRLDPIGPQQLALIDCRSRAEHAVEGARAVPGRPRFLEDGRLAIDGGPVAQILTFQEPL